MTYTFILNPTARAGRTGRLEVDLAQWAAAGGLDAQIARTAAPGHAAALARAAAEAGRAVVAVGGDGTVHEVACGLIAAGAPTPLGVIPCGTGNDFAKLTGLPRRPQQAVAALATAVPRAFDYGVVAWAGEDGAGERPFVNAVGAGLDGAVAAAVGRYKHLPGMTGYLVAALEGLRRWHAPVARVVTDDGLLYEGPLLLTTVANGRSSGGHFLLTPHAAADDGRLDVCCIRDLPFRRVASLIPRVVVGRHGAAPEVNMRQATVVTLAAEAPLPLHADGEVLAAAARTVTARVVPGGLRVLVAQRGAA